MKHRPFILVALSSLVVVVYFLHKFSPYSYELGQTDEARLLTVYTELSAMNTSKSAVHLPEEDTNDIGIGRRKYFASKDVIIRAVYFDDRPRDNHQNATVFLVLVWKVITDNKLISDCQVDGNMAKAYSVKLIGETKLWRAYKEYNKIDHEEVLVHCYDVPSRNNSEAFLYYRTSVNCTTVKMAKSERLVMFPAPRISPTSVEGVKYNMTLLTCTKVYGNPPWLRKWLVYQRSIGVDHVHLIADESFFRGISKDLVYYLEELMDEGFLSIDFWIMWLANGKEVWYHNQGLILEDCIYQFRGTYDYVFILDTDDFFVPRVVGEPKAHYYVDKLCVRDNTGTCKFRWVEYYPDHFGMNASVPILDGNITSQLMNYTHQNQGNRKSVHKTQALVDAATHYAFNIIAGYKRVEYPINVAYVAHLRQKKNPPKGKVVAGLP